MKNILKILSLILLFTFMVSCGGSKYETVDLTDFVYLKAKNAKINNMDERQQMYDYTRRMLYFKLPIYNMDGGDYYLDDNIFGRFNESLQNISGDNLVQFHNIIGNLAYDMFNDNVKYSDIKSYMNMIENLDSSKEIKNNLVKPDYLVPYYIIKVMYTHLLIASIGIDYTTEQQKIIDAELEDYIKTISEETKEHPWYTKAKEVDKIFHTHIINYVDMVRELAKESKETKYGARRPIWIFTGSDLENKYYELNTTSQDENDEKLYNLDYTDNYKLIEEIWDLRDTKTDDFESIKAKIQK